jgi:hypothetical protein
LPRQQRFEGETLEAVLERVRVEAGTGAKVLEAKKVRDGGLAGFFSKEKFVLTVEVPDAPRKLSKKAAAAAAASRAVIDGPLADDAAAIAPPSSILEMVDLVDEAEQEITLPLADAAPVRKWYEDPPVPEAPAAPTPEELGFEALDLPVVTRLEPVVLETEERPPAPVPSTETDAFRSVLDRIAQQSGVEDLLVDELVEDDDTVEDEADDVPTSETEDEMHPTYDESPLVDDIVDLDVDVEDAPLPAEIVPVSPAIATRMRRTGSVFARSLSLELLELGIPQAHLPHIDETMDRDAIHAAIVRHLQLPVPPALPRRTNAVVAVVGERRAALRLATLLGKEPALSDAGIAVADRDGTTSSVKRARPSTKSKSASTTRGQRRRATKRIIAVPAAPGSSSEWARDLLDELEPDMVWGVVPAERKSEDVAAWAVEIGGMDVMALTGADKTVSPATVLRLGIPVGLLDWRLATPEAWADLLTDRLAA